MICTVRGFLLDPDRPYSVDEVSRISGRRGSLDGAPRGASLEIEICSQDSDVCWTFVGSQRCTERNGIITAGEPITDYQLHVSALHECVDLADQISACLKAGFSPESEVERQIEFTEPERKRIVKERLKSFGLTEMHARVYNAMITCGKCALDTWADCAFYWHGHSRFFAGMVAWNATCGCPPDVEMLYTRSTFIYRMKDAAERRASTEFQLFMLVVLERTALDPEVNEEVTKILDSMFSDSGRACSLLQVNLALFRLMKEKYRFRGKMPESDTLTPDEDDCDELLSELETARE